MFSPIDEIKNRLDIVDVIGSYLKLQKTGANYRVLCPFHSEKKPSLFVSPSRQIWKCFGCGAGGGIFDFVMKIEGIEFGDALRILARKAGVELKKPDPEFTKWQTEKTRLYEICELATQFFEKQLGSKTRKAVKNYLLDRGLRESSIKKWRLGYAPDTWQGLSEFLTCRGYKKEEVEKAGLGISSPPASASSSGERRAGEISSFYDRFRGRIIFPIFDLNSQVSGFGGRIFKEKNKEEIAKYINTPNTLLYDKSRILYGLDKAKVEIRKRDFCILVEGYMDVILVSQGGYENVVAVSGTALTSPQLKMLKRYSQNLYTAFDMDVAGGSATKRGIDLARAQGFNIKVITMPEDKDPADIVSKNPLWFDKLVGEAKSILEFYFETAFSKFDPKKVEGKVEISKALLPSIKRIPNKIAQSHWIGELAKRLMVREEDLEVELKKINLEEYGEKESDFRFALSETEKSFEKSEIKKNRKDLLEERITSLILKYPQYLKLISEDYLSYFSPDSREILEYLKQHPGFNFNSLADFKEGEVPAFSPELTRFLSNLCFAVEVDYNPLQEKFDSEDLPNPEDEVRVCIREIKNFEIKNELNQISEKIKIAEENKEIKKAEDLIKKFNDLSQKLIDR